MYRSIAQIGKKLRVSEIVADARQLISDQIHEMFKAYFRSSARDSLLANTKERNVGVFSLVSSKGDSFYEIKFAGMGSLDSVYDYPIYRKFSGENIRRNIDVLRKSRCLVKDNVVRYKFCRLLNFSENWWVFKEEGSSLILKYNNPQEFTAYLLVTPETEAIFNNETDYRIAYANGQVFTLSEDNYRKLEESKECQFAALLPEEFVVRFCSRETEVPGKVAVQGVAGKSLEFAYKLDLERGKVMPQEISIRKKLPLRFLYYNYQEFRNCIYTLKRTIRNYLLQFAPDIETEDDWPRIAMDFSSINDLPMSAYYTLTEAVKRELYILSSAFCQVVAAVEPRTAESLPSVLGKANASVGTFCIGAKLVFFLQSHLINILPALGDLPSRNDELVLIEGSSLHLRIPLHYNASKGNIEWLLDDSLVHCIADKILDSICTFELNSLKEAASDSNLESNVTWNADNLLSISEHLGWAETVMRELFGQPSKM